MIEISNSVGTTKSKRFNTYCRIAISSLMRLPRVSCCNHSAAARLP